MTDEDILSVVIRREGGGAYTNDPADRGGPTRWGVTQATLAGWRGHPVSAAEVEALSEDEAKAIYRAEYLQRPGLSLIVNDALRALVFDAAVNHGPHQAIELLQRALGIREDGIIGSVTLAALPHLDAQRLGMKFLHQRAVCYARIVQHDPTQARFLAGWTNRIWEQAQELVA